MFKIINQHITIWCVFCRIVLAISSYQFVNFFLQKQDLFMYLFLQCTAVNHLFNLLKNATVSNKHFHPSLGCKHRSRHRCRCSASFQSIWVAICSKVIMTAQAPSNTAALIHHHFEKPKHKIWHMVFSHYHCPLCSWIPVAKPSFISSSSQPFVLSCWICLPASLCSL